MLRYVRRDGAHYDDLCCLDLRTEHGLVGRVVQDVVTRPSRKRARIQGSKGSLEWVAGYGPDGDAVILHWPGTAEETYVLRKTRPDDFIQELKALDSSLHEPASNCPLGLERGLETMLVIAAAHLSDREKRRVRINHSLGCQREALVTAEPEGSLP
jgi:predicted dehydrogenase